MGYFVDLTLDMYGGETAMINDVGEDTFLSYRLLFEKVKAKI